MTIVSILGVLFSLLVEKIAFGIARWYYKVFRGIEFKGDMFSVATLAKERGKIIERTDSDFHEVYALKKSVYVEVFTIFILFLVGIPLLVVILLTLFIEIIITANGIFFLGIFYSNFPSGDPVWNFSDDATGASFQTCYFTSYRWLASQRADFCLQNN